MPDNPSEPLILGIEGQDLIVSHKHSFNEEFRVRE